MCLYICSLDEWPVDLVMVDLVHVLADLVHVLVV